MQIASKRQAKGRDYRLNFVQRDADTSSIKIQDRMSLFGDVCCSSPLGLQAFEDVVHIIAAVTIFRTTTYTV